MPERPVRGTLTATILALRVHQTVNRTAESTLYTKSPFTRTIYFSLSESLVTFSTVGSSSSVASNTSKSSVPRYRGWFSPDHQRRPVDLDAGLKMDIERLRSTNSSVGKQNSMIVPMQNYSCVTSKPFVLNLACLLFLLEIHVVKRWQLDNLDIPVVVKYTF